MERLRPTKHQLAKIKVWSDLGLTPNAIAQKVGKDPKTVRKYLNSEVFELKDIKELVLKIKEKELSDLNLLGAKGRYRLHEHLDGGKMRPIEVIAAMDRCFQQRRLLEGQSTENISHHSLIEQIDADREKLMNALRLLE